MLLPTLMSLLAVTGEEARMIFNKNNIFCLPIIFIRFNKEYTLRIKMFFIIGSSYYYYLSSKYVEHFISSSTFILIFKS